MPSCPNGHPEIWDMACDQCKVQIPYDQEIDKLLEPPAVEVNFESLTALFVGLGPVKLPEEYITAISIGDEQSEAVESLVLAKIDGGTWLDYSEKYAAIVDSWLRRVGFQYSKYRMLVIDTLNPLSILVLRNKLIDSGVLVIAITADKTSTPLYKNTSYVALKEAYRKNLPLILIEESYVKDLAYFDEDSGLVTGEYAFRGIIASYARNIQTIISFIEGDKRLGINMHTMSTLVSASDQVYPDMDSAFGIQRYINSVDKSEGDFQSVHLLGFSPKDMHAGIELAFKSYTEGFKDLLSSEVTIFDKTSHYNFYDLYLLYGLKEDPVLGRIEDGYKSVAKKIHALSWEAG